MIEKATATGNICWPREAYEFILNQITKQSAGDFLKNQLLKYQIATEGWEDLYQYFKGIEKEFNISLTDEDQESVNKYFTTQVEELGCGAGLLLFFDDLNFDESMEEFKYRMSNLTQEEIDIGFDQQLLGLGNGMGGMDGVDEPSTESKSSTLSILQHIAELNLSDQEKWKIQELYVNFREHNEKVVNILEKAHYLMSKDFLKIKKYQDEFQGYWTKTLETKSIYQMLRKELQLDIDENPMGCIIYPNLMGISTIKLAENGEAGETRSKTIFCLGILFGQDYSFSRKVEDKQKEQDLFVILKLLSDKSKFEILQLTADDWRYGSEIAKTIKLTSATISYHMNTLVQARLVEIKKEEKKIFFRQNKAYLTEMLEFCEKLIQNK